METLRPMVGMTALQQLVLLWCSLPRELEADAIPFPLHRLEGWTGECFWKKAAKCSVDLSEQQATSTNTALFGRQSLIADMAFQCRSLL